LISTALKAKLVSLSTASLLGPSHIPAFVALVGSALVLSILRRNGVAAGLGLLRSVIISKAATVVEAVSRPNTGM
jgi:hypothetical protein